MTCKESLSNDIIINCPSFKGGRNRWYRGVGKYRGKRMDNVGLLMLEDLINLVIAEVVSVGVGDCKFVIEDLFKFVHMFLICEEPFASMVLEG